MKNETTENATKRKARTKVALKTTFSRPLLVKEDEDPQLLPKPVPLV